jgi:hypothetical protein
MKSLNGFFAATLLLAGVAAFAQQGQQQSFDSLKALAGSWTGSVNTDEDGKIPEIHVTMRVTSMGNTLMHEMQVNGQPDDPITMFTLDSGRLVLTHYCDAGNQPHMAATVSPDGKTLTFDFVSASNLLPTQHGHMQHVVFTLIDANHHTELWQFAMADGKTMGAVMDLHRAK